MKIMVIGYSGSGKSTLAEYLGKKYEIPILHLDHIFWLPGWKSRSREEMQRIVARFLKHHNSWVIDGNYTKTEYEHRLAQADRIIFLSFNRFSCLYRVWRRYQKYKGRTRKDMGRGCKEKLDREFIHWVLWEGRDARHQAEYREVQKKYRKKVIRIRNQRQLDWFMKTV